MSLHENVHTWEMLEVELIAETEYDNPYLDVDVWVDLEGPGFSKRIYGFWDGGASFKIRFVASLPGGWSWKSGASVPDHGLVGKTGRLTALPWSESEKLENPCRRGFLQPTPNGHAFQYADGTRHYYLADTWWATPTFRYPWADDQQPKPEWAEMSFQEMVAYRKEQGFNGIAMMAAFPAWASDGKPSTIQLEDEEQTPLRHAWQLSGSADLNKGPEAQAKDMHNEGGRPFLFPGRVPGYEDVVPDYLRINPDYFRYMDRKVSYLNSQGMIPFIEVARRDVAPAWKKYYPWPESYARYIHYIFCRYHAYNTLLSPIHFDFSGFTIPSREFNAPANLVVDSYGPPPFGNPVGTNSAPSSLVNFGGPDEARWLTFHQIGNWRPHDTYWFLTEIYNAKPARPALNGEPYYPGFPNDDPSAPSPTADRYCRSGMYGSFLSGGLAGYIYGVEGMWGGNIETQAKYRMWDAIGFTSGDQVRHLAAFVYSKGKKYEELIPDHELLVPSRSGAPKGYDGWAYCAHTTDKEWLMLYFEQDCPQIHTRSLLPNTDYSFTFYNPRNGEWLKDSAVLVSTDQTGVTHLPELPSEGDWAASMERI